MDCPDALHTLAQGRGGDRGGGGGRGGRRGWSAVLSLQREREVVTFPWVSGALKLGGAIRDRGDEGGRVSYATCLRSEKGGGRNGGFSRGIKRVRAVTARSRC